MDDKKTVTPQMKKASTIVAVVFMLLIVFGLVQCVRWCNSPLEPQKPLTREESIKSQFSGFDGSHKKLTLFIKKGMHDPSSYEHIATRYWDYKDHLIVNTEFRGKNAFGALVVNNMKAKVDIDGNIIDIIE